MNIKQREIKFRIWDDFVKKFTAWNMLHVGSIDFNDLFETEDLVFQQFTGLIDKNGKEIYEGDIVIKHYNKNSSKPYPVTWNNQNCGFCLTTKRIESMTQGKSHEYEIIGNIFETPELLKQ